ncbi:MAG: hypothetical protein GXP55_00020 [Deltaproteobacteria bacterium]|nr:hypothetical protein [Deltaproteobacteria bacterium]
MKLECIGMVALLTTIGCGSSDGSNATDSGLLPDAGSADASDAASADATSADASDAASADAAADDASAPDASTPYFEPYFADDFETYSDGQSLTDGRPFGTAGHTTASTTEAFSGSTSARMEIRAGDGGGFGRWGASVNLRPKLGKGSEVWVRLRVFWPASFQFTASPWMKFLRIHNQNEDGSNDGYNDLYIDEPDDSSRPTLRCIKEKHDVWETDDGTPLPRDTWQSYEMYLYADDVPVDEGGNARMRIWKDNVLIFDRTDVPTLATAGGNLDLFYLFTYWNNEMPPNNHCFVDDLILATDASPPPNTDAAGNRMIGDWTIP